MAHNYYYLIIESKANRDQTTCIFTGSATTLIHVSEITCDQNNAINRQAIIVKVNSK